MPPTGVPDTRTGLHCSIFVQRCKICFLKAVCVENARLILSYFYVQLVSPLHKCLTTPHCYTICSDPNSEALLSFSNPSDFQKPYQSLLLCYPASKPCFPIACYHHHFQAPRVLYYFLLHTSTFLAFSSILHRKN